MSLINREALLSFEKSKLHDSMNTEIYITGESLVVDIIYHSYGTADIKLHMVFGRILEEGADNG